MEPLPPGCQVHAWAPAVPGVAEVFHARISNYAYPMHCHDTWTVLIVDDGAIEYDLDTRHHGAARDLVTILPPGVAHNGRPAWRAGSFRKRNLYLDAGFLPPTLVGRAVDGPAFRDPLLRSAVSALHAELVSPDPLDVSVRLAQIASRFSSRLLGRTDHPVEHSPVLAERLRDYLLDQLAGEVSLVAAAQLLDRSVPHLVRVFRRHYQISPYAYVVGARVERARALLLQGVPPAEVATAVGFYDQSHLTRHFKRHVSVTPARYARGT